MMHLNQQILNAETGGRELEEALCWAWVNTDLGYNQLCAISWHVSCRATGEFAQGHRMSLF